MVLGSPPSPVGTGTVESIAFRHWPHLPNVSDGVRVVRMFRREAIPRHLSIGDFQVKISYTGLQQVCDLCAAPGHITRVCPLKGKCFQCGLEGHLSRNCPQRAGYQARDVAEEDVSDPTPAEAAARASGAPQAESDEDLGDNQLDELSQSILAPVLAGVLPVGSSFPADNVSVDSIDGISNENNLVVDVDNIDITVEDNEVMSNKEVNNNLANGNLVNNDVVGNNVVNNNGSNVVMNESIVVNNNLANESTVNNNGNNKVEISKSENSAANQNTIEEPNYSPISHSVNIVDPGSSSLCVSSLDSDVGNLVEPSSSDLFSSGVSDVVMEGASDSRKRAHTEVSSDGDSVDSSSFKSKLPVRKQKGVRKTPAPASSTATPRATRSSSLIPGLSKGLRFAAAEWGRLSKRS